MNKAAFDFATDGDCIKALIRKGRNDGYIKIEELMKCLSPEITEPDQIKDIVSFIEDMGIAVKY